MENGCMSSKTVQWVVFGAVGWLALTGCQPQNRTNPGLAQKYYVRGQILADQGQEDEALAELYQAVKNDPDLSVAQEAIGDIHRKRGQQHMARIAYEQAVRANPYSFDPAYKLGVTYQAIARATQNLLEAQNYLQKAVEVYLRAITLKSDDYDAHINLSASYFDLGKVTLAEHYCKAAIEIDPTRQRGYRNLALIQSHQNRLYDAVASYRKALEFDVHQPDILMRLGDIYIQQGRTDAAISVLRSAAGEAPKDPMPWIRMGVAYFHQQQFEESIAAYDKAIELDGDNAVAWKNRGYSYMVQFRNSPSQTALRDKALESWNRSLDSNSNQPDLRRLVEKYTPQRQLPEL